MRAKCLALIIAGFVLVAVSSAQEYSVRANTGLNLRAAPSLNADIADTVRAGTILQVVGEYGRWLKINRGVREVWLADWVDYRRVESGSPPASPAPTAPIDNCCSVDRQCQSDQEWIDGYWAYQNGQCAAPSQPQPVTPAQPVASAPANVDNCCYVNRQCLSDQDWVNGYHAFLNGQCAAPSQPQPVTPAQPVASAPSGQPVNNCCFVDRECQSNDEWIAGYQAFQRGQCIPPVPAGGGNCCDLGWQCRYEEERAQGYWVYQINQCAGLPQASSVTLTGPVPRIEGSNQFVQHIKATLKFMKSVAPAWYNYVITGLDSIVEEPVHVEPYRDGQITNCWAFANLGERKATVQTCHMTWTVWGTGAPEFDQASTAGVLGHEACHIHRHEEGFIYNDSTSEHEEKMCGKMGSGAGVLLASALATGLSPRRGTSYFEKERALSRYRQYCSEGYRSDLFCPTLQRLESIWRNVPYAIFPPGAPSD